MRVADVLHVHAQLVGPQKFQARCLLNVLSVPIRQSIKEYLQRRLWTEITTLNILQAGCRECVSALDKRNIKKLAEKERPQEGIKAVHMLVTQIAILAESVERIWHFL